MDRRHLQKALSSLLFAVMPAPQIFASVCVYKPPTVGHVRGRIMDRSDYPIPHAQVTLMRGQDVVQTSSTGEAGEFNFDSLSDGKYEIDVRAIGFQHARYTLKLSSHKKTKRVLRITLGIGTIQCQGSIETEEQTIQR